MTTTTEVKTWEYHEAKLWLLAVQEAARDEEFEGCEESCGFFGAWWDALYDYLNQGAEFDL